ncbi:uncharacterized protein [Chelonus insularis]|uniref:uncharacterized protein n=1 Tax=Chelonus insularis TaxID=460826 RepID=UPI00158BF907|nr:uncharacterized protein LOC118066041 [Chelonus insularis]
MDEVTTMTISSTLPSGKVCHQSQGGRQTVSGLAVAPTFSQLPSEAGATVYVAGSASKADSPGWSTIFPKVQSVNNCSLNQRTSEHHQQQPAHVVKIKINPELDNSRVISTVHLTPDETNLHENGVECLIKHDNTTNVNTRNVINGGASVIESCVRISVVNEADHQLSNQQRDEMVQRGSTESVNNTNRSNTCFYYGPFQNSFSTMIMSSGQCSPSDTLDSGTCSDLDGTPPPLPKKKNSSTIVLSSTPGQHNRTGSLTSSGAEGDSDDNESSISCDSLNSGELAARVIESTLKNDNDVSCDKSRDLSSNDINVQVKHDDVCEKSDLKATTDELERIRLSTNNNNKNDVNKNYEKNEKIQEKSSSTVDMISSSTRESSSTLVSSSNTCSLSKSTSSTPPMPSPNPLANGRLQPSSPVVKECTYEERKKEQDRLEQETAAAERYANYNRDNGTKYLYEDDRFYKFHINELQPDNDDSENRKKLEDNEVEEYFAGYKILDKEAIRSAKGTVRGVKNRVRAGIATFLQNPSSKNYRQKDSGKVVVYTTSMGVVPKTRFACLKMRHILNTHMVQYEERDLYRSSALQTELKDRLASDCVQVPQLFIDGQHIGDADAVEQLNESGELRPMLKPFKFLGVHKICSVCGDAGFIPCTSCHGSKKSWRWHGFLNEICALRCTNCDEMGLMPCPTCLR